MSAPDPAFDAEVAAGPIVDNAGALYVVGQLELPGECTCPALLPGHDDAVCAAATWGGEAS